MKHLTSIADSAASDLRHYLDVARRLKREYQSQGHNEPILKGKTLAMIFEKPSLRTRVSFTIAMHQLGGSALMLRQEEVGLESREPTRDVARVLSSMADGILARTFEHAKILELAKWSTVPVINGLTDLSHPCQAMADLMTIEEHFGTLAGKTLAFIGDGNNVAKSLAIACGKFEMRFVLACPSAYGFPSQTMDRMMGQSPNMDFSTTLDPAQAVRDADVIYTDTWVSMGQEVEKAKRIQDFNAYQVNAELLKIAPKTVIVLHCLPAYRGNEITDEVIEGPHSMVFKQAENRLHFQKGLLADLLTAPKR